MVLVPWVFKQDQTWPKVTFENKFNLQIFQF